VGDIHDSFGCNTVRPQSRFLTDKAPSQIKPTVINVIIADHQPVFRTGLAKLLAAEDDMRVISHPLSTDHLLNAIEKLRPHVVILSSGFLAEPSDLNTITAMANAHQVPVLMLTQNTSEGSPQFIPGNVQGVFYRSVKGRTLVEGVRRLARGGSYVQMHSSVQDVSPDLVGQRVTSRLSRRELRIIAAIIRGYKNSEIAEQLETTVPLVKKMVGIIYDKTGVSGRLELALFVVHHQVLAQAAAAEHTAQPAVRLACREEERNSRAVESLFYSPAKSRPQSHAAPTRIDSRRNHSWYHPTPPDCGKKSM
jgi:DNA-binding NarL/FixJ family response regulator